MDPQLPSGDRLWEGRASEVLTLNSAPGASIPRSPSNLQQPDSPDAGQEAEGDLVRPTCPPQAPGGALLSVNLQAGISGVSEQFENYSLIPMLSQVQCSELTI